MYRRCTNTVAKNIICEKQTVRHFVTAYVDNCLSWNFCKNFTIQHLQICYRQKKDYFFSRLFASECTMFIKIKSQNRSRLITAKRSNTFQKHKFNQPNPLYKTRKSSSLVFNVILFNTNLLQSVRHQARGERFVKSYNARRVSFSFDDVTVQQR